MIPRKYLKSINQFLKYGERKWGKNFTRMKFRKFDKAKYFRGIDF